MPDFVTRAVRGIGGPDQDPPADARQEALCVLQQAIDHEQAPHSRRRRVLLMPVLAVVAVALGAATYAAVGHSPPEGGIACFSSPGHDARHATIADVDGRKATTVCAELWQTGQVVSGTHATPPLVACVGATQIEVFPTGDARLCDRLGQTPVPDAGADPATRRFAALRDALEQQLVLSHECVASTAAHRATADALNAHGFGDWTVSVQPFTPEMPCARPGFDSERKTIVLSGGKRYTRAMAERDRREALLPPPTD